MDLQTSGIVRLLRALALVVVIEGYVVYIRANEAEASAIFNVGGDAGLWAVGIVVVTAMLVPGAILLLVSLAIRPRAKRSPAIAAYGGVFLLAPTVWLAVNTYPPEKETDEGQLLNPMRWDHVADLYLGSFVLMGVAGVLLLISALPSLQRRTSEDASQSTSN